jgi:hypothetical protein
MKGDVIREGRPQPNNVPYLSQGCGAKKFTERGAAFGREIALLGPFDLMPSVDE